MSHFKDHFSGVSDRYRRSRPTYPGALFSAMAGLAPGTGHAWDCATGNGQAAIGLAGHFDRVTATDASDQQIAQAQAHPRITYRTAPAEASGLPDAVVDLICVAQAVHWFDHAAFNAEAMRVLKPWGAMVWVAYQLTRVSPAVDEIIRPWYWGPLMDWWPEERAHIDDGYESLAFPFEPIELPAFALSATWDVDAFLAYLNTWSGVTRMNAGTGGDVVAEIAGALRAAWGPDRRTVTWPLIIKAGRKSGA